MNDSPLKQTLRNLINLAAANRGRTFEQALPGGATLYLTITGHKRTFAVHRPRTYPERREAHTFLKHWPEDLPAPWPDFKKDFFPPYANGHGYALVAEWEKPKVAPQATEAPAPEPVQQTLF